VDGAKGESRPTTHYPLVAYVPLPPKGPLDRRRAKTDLLIGSQVALAIVLLLLVVVFVPRPNIRLTGARFEGSPCNQATSSLVVTAYFSLTNTGRSDGDLFVRFYVDGQQRRASEDFFVPAEMMVNRSLSVDVKDCSSHRYSLETCLPTQKYATC